jgi:hypothetical protein
VPSYWCTLMVPFLHFPGVIPAKAGIHAGNAPRAGCEWQATDMDSGLRRNDPVGGELRRLEEDQRITRRCALVAQSLHFPGVIPAKAGIHAGNAPRARCTWCATDMDSGLRRNDPVGGEIWELEEDQRITRRYALVAQSLHFPGVIPAKAGIHAGNAPRARCTWCATDMDSGLRRNDPVGVEPWGLEE